MDNVVDGFEGEEEMVVCGCIGGWVEFFFDLFVVEIDEDYVVWFEGDVVYVVGFDGEDVFGVVDGGGVVEGEIDEVVFG